MTRSSARWLLPLLGGFSCVIVLVFWYHATHPVYPPDVLRMSKGLGIPPDRCQDLREILAAVDQKPPGPDRITNDQWRRVKQHMGSSIANERAEALSIMGQLSKTPHRSEVITIAQSSLSDQNPYVLATVMITLSHMDDPSWRSKALENQDSPDQTLRMTSRALLKKGSKAK